jgi:hypothetical protein
MANSNEVERAAAEMVLRRDAQQISESGNKAYGESWANSVRSLETFGLNGSDFIGTIMDIAGCDKTHEIAHEIGRDVEKASNSHRCRP